jgi:hypothetical protein
VPRRREVLGEAHEGLAPAPLRDHLDPVWQSVESTRAWYRSEGLPSESISPAGPNTRLKGAVDAWSRANGLTRTFGQNPALFPDWDAIRASGVAPSNGRSIRERLAYHAAQIRAEER